MQLRNDTRGHGAIPSATYGRICNKLEHSIRLIIENFYLFKRPWAYLYRSLSGKYRITKLTEQSTSLDFMKTRQGIQIAKPDGAYIHFDQTEKLDALVSVALFDTTVDAIDFFLPNGAFTDARYETISYLTGDKSYADSTPFLQPIVELPTSETQGLGIFEVQGNCFANLPPPTSEYIERSKLEEELHSELILSDHHPIITLVGRGGIGKTSLALAVLHKIIYQNRFSVVIWFSSRDIDLLPNGPKIVKPQVVSVKDVANEFSRLMQPQEAIAKKFNSVEYMNQYLSKSEVGPILFVFDNFETLQSPSEFFFWLDNNIRPPNKALITTRFREFKGDYPVEVLGMNEQECDELIDRSAISLGIKNILTHSYRQDLFRESDGHPYVIKVLLGEVAKAKSLIPIERIVATQDDILNALFERTFSRLSPVAQRVFLTLCGWRSLVPRLAVEAVLLRPTNEKMDVGRGIEELALSSLIEITFPDDTSEAFISTPLVASEFGRRKLAVHTMKSAVEADIELLRYFGAVQKSGIQHGITPHIEQVFRNIAKQLEQGLVTIDEFIPTLEFIARRYSPAWLLLADLYEEFAPENNLEKAKEATGNYLEVPDESINPWFAWNKLAILCAKLDDYVGEVHALVEMCQLPGTWFDRVSSTANKINSLFSRHELILDTLAKQILVSRLVQVMERRIDEANATDCSRLAWLCFHLQDKNKARLYTQRGLSIDSENIYCIQLLRHLPT